MTLLARISALAAAVAILVAAGAWGAWEWQANKYQGQIDRIEGDHAKALAISTESIRAIERRKQNDIEEIRNEFAEKIKAERLAVDSAERDADSMREQVREFAKRADNATRNACPTTGGTPTITATGVLAELYARIDRAAGVYAAAADASRLAGQACSQSYDSLGLSAAPDRLENK